MTVRKGLDEAYKIGASSQKHLDNLYFALNIKLAFNELKDSNFYRNLSIQERRYIDECESKIREVIKEDYNE